MNNKESSFLDDIDKVQQIPIVSTMLDVICQTTGMGFAAIARVTADRWIACSVQDEISFGLKAREELQIETTICSEIREAHKPVIIDNVSEDPFYQNHHTPRIYGFQSYISFPIFLKDGQFFGTLCAIDPKPAMLNNPKVVGMFKLFADLLSFHLHNIEITEKSRLAVQHLSRQLDETLEENRQYQYISNHNLEEPLRKIRIFSDMLVKATKHRDHDKAENFAIRIHASAQKFSMMIKDLSNLSELSVTEANMQKVDMNVVVQDVCAHMKSEMHDKDIHFEISNVLPDVKGVATQMEQLIYQVLHNAIRFCKKDGIPVIKVTSLLLTDEEARTMRLMHAGQARYTEIRLEDNGIGIQESQLERIFDIFSHLPIGLSMQSGGVGLAYCRKIVRNHGGIIRAESKVDIGTTISIILPLA